jgi:hypothetical protein
MKNNNNTLYLSILSIKVQWIYNLIEITLIADASSEPEASEQVSSSNSYWGLLFSCGF